MPSLTQAVVRIVNSSSKTVTINAATPASELTISNFVISAQVGEVNTLQLTNMNGATPLHVLQVLSVTNRGVLFLTNASVQVDGPTAGATAFVDDGTITLRSGGTNSVFNVLTIGSTAGATGTLWIAGGYLSTSNNTAIGDNGVARLTISNGTWQGSSAVVGGNAGASGTLTVAGGTNELSSLLLVGFNLGATGSLWLTGGQLIATNSNNTVGRAGVGQMTVSNGTWQGGLVFVGAFAGSSGTLTLAGGTNVLSSGMFVGSNAGATGSVWQTGGQLVAMNDNIRVGNSGIGQMTQSNGTAQLLALQIGVNDGSRGTVTVAGGTNSVDVGLFIGNTDCTATGSVVVAGGNLFVTNNTGNAVLEVRTGTLTLSSGTLKVDTFMMTSTCGHFARTGGTLLYGTAVLDPNRDDDGDGIANGWEQQYGLDPLNAGDANIDSDGDGFTHLQEYLAGTNPTNLNSALRIISVMPQPPDMRIVWTTAGGKTNAVQATNGNGGNYATNFSPLASIVIGGTGDVTNQFLDFGGATNKPARYYRVRLVP